MTHLIGWAVSISVFLGGVFWAKIGMTDAQVDKVKIGQAETIERVATVEEAIRTIKTDNAEIKNDIKILLQRTK